MNKKYIIVNDLNQFDDEYTYLNPLYIILILALVYCVMCYFYRHKK